MKRRRRFLSPVAAADSVRDHGPKSGAIDTRIDVAVGVVVVISIRVQTRVVFLVPLEIRVTPDEKSNSG